MSGLYFHVIKRSVKPGVNNQNTKYFASLRSGKTVNTYQFIKRVEKASGLSGPDVRGVLYAIMDQMHIALGQGETLVLDDLGTFRLQISSIGQDHPDKVTTETIKSAEVKFSPALITKEFLKELVKTSQIKRKSGTN